MFVGLVLVLSALTAQGRSLLPQKRRPRSEYIPSGKKKKYPCAVSRIEMHHAAIRTERRNAAILRPPAGQGKIPNS